MTMKTLIQVSIFAGALFSQGPAHATGLMTTVFDCHSAVNGPSYSLRHFETSPPGGPVTSYYEFSASESEMGPVAVIRLYPTNTFVAGTSSVTKYMSGERASMGYIDLVNVDGTLFLGADLQRLGGTAMVRTEGLVALSAENGFICSR